MTHGILIEVAQRMAELVISGKPKAHQLSRYEVRQEVARCLGKYWKILATWAR